MHLNDIIQEDNGARSTPPRPDTAPAPAPAGTLPPADPFLFQVAANLYRLLDLSRDQHVAIWKRIVGLYQQVGRALPACLRDLCDETFVDALLEDEIFWGLAGNGADRQLYAEAPGHLSAVYATAALLAARMDRLELLPADRVLFGEGS